MVVQEKKRGKNHFVGRGAKYLCALVPMASAGMT